MIAPKRPPMVAPTTAVWCLSFLQTSERGAAFASNGVPVETAVATTCVGSEAEEGVTFINEPMEEVVTLGAAALLQQLRVSPMARQQYLPISHCWMLTAFEPPKLSLLTMTR